MCILSWVSYKERVFTIPLLGMLTRKADATRVVLLCVYSRSMNVDDGICGQWQDMDLKARTLDIVSLGTYRTGSTKDDLLIY